MANWSQVQEAVSKAEAQGAVGVGIIAPDGSRWAHNGQRKFGAASTMKIPLMIETYRQVEGGKRSLDDIIPVNAEDKAVGSGVLHHLHDGIEVTLRDLIYLMISISDNTATNMLIRMATMDAVNATMRDLGMTGSNLGREMKGRPAVEGEEENWATPEDYVTVVKSILDRQAASATSCDEMVIMLERQQNSRRIARHLPDDKSIRWGSKTGTIKGVCNDVGFVTTPKGTTIIAVFTEAMPNTHTAEEHIGNISRAALQDTGLL